jgi:hypothetical protein
MRTEERKLGAQKIPCLLLFSKAEYLGFCTSVHPRAGKREGSPLARIRKVRASTTMRRQLQLRPSMTRD